MRRSTLGLDDVYAYLGAMPDMSKKAIAFCLFADLTMADVIDLRWGDDLPYLTDKALSILSTVEMRDDSDIVFWVNGSGEISPSANLLCQFEVNTVGIGWGNFVRMFESAVAIDFEQALL